MAKAMHKKSAYSRLDRLVHNLAFGVMPVAEIATDIESALLARSWADIEIERPIFITSLPRAGTTVLLDLLHRFPGLAAHTYRDMPFVMAPVLWAKLTRPFQRPVVGSERAHGDGMLIDADSPEALEEVLWLDRYARKYEGTTISLSDADDFDAAFTRDFEDHMRKIVRLRGGGTGRVGRYLSKNNANISRISLLQRMFADASILVPVRHPLEQASSMLRQHENFTRQHRDDAFVRKYMADIGHFEFGELHKPIRFEGVEAILSDSKSGSRDYWLAYWIAAFEHLGSQPDLTFLSYEAICASGAKGLRIVCDRLGIEATKSDIDAAASVLRPPTHRARPSRDARSALVERACAIHEELARRSVSH